MSHRDPSKLRAQVVALESRKLRQAKAEIAQLQAQVASAERRCDELAVYFERFAQAQADTERLKRRVDELQPQRRRPHRAKHSRGARRLVLTPVDELVDP